MRNQLHELLQEDQEPFKLQDYIADRRQRLHSRRFKSTSASLRHSSKFTTKLCKNGCFFAGSDSPDVTKSPAENFILLHVPARTAAMLLEASARIRNPNKSESKRTFGSFLKKLKQSSSDGEKREKNEVGVLVKDILRRDSSTAFIERSVTLRENPTFSPAIPAINCDKSLEIDDFETEFLDSPFRFVLHNDPYDYQTTNSSSPVDDSPSCAETEERDEKEDLMKKGGNEGEKVEEEEEHCSPVSVLDPDPYDEEEDNIEEIHEEDDESRSSFDMDRSYANVQRAQDRLLEKLSRFERLAGLDPLELELRFQEDDQEYSDEFDFSDVWEKKCEESESSSNKKSLSYVDQLAKEVLEQTEFKALKRVPAELKKVIKIVLTEEEGKLVAFDDKNILLERVVRRLASWKEAVAFDITDGFFGWGRRQEQLTDAVTEIEASIFAALVEELCEELEFLS
ncbi:unnamed protein product [Rhodiola kirilowii]